MSNVPTPGVPLRTSPRLVAIRGKAFELVTQLLLVTLVPRLLGPAEFGRMTVALAIVTLGSVAISLGAPSSFARFVPTEPEGRRAGLARAMTRDLLPLRGVQLGVAALVTAGIVLFAPGIGALDATLVFVALVAEVAAFLAAQVALGLGETWIWSFRVSARNVVLLVLVPVLTSLMGPAGVLSAVALGSVAGFLFAASQAAPLVRHAERGVPVPAGAILFGSVVGFGMLVAQLTWRGPVVAASLLGLSAEQVGFAGLAVSIALAIIFAVRELFTVSLTELVELWSRDPSEADRRLSYLGERAQWILAACAVLGVVAMDRVLPLVVGDKFTPAIGPMIPVMALLPLLPLQAVGVQASALRLRPGLPLAIDSVSLVAFVAASLVLVPRWEAVGATAAMLIAILTSVVLTARALPSVITLRFLAVGILSSGAVLGVAAAAGIGR